MPYSIPNLPLSKQPLYNTWRGMIYRCHNSNCKNYDIYGGRGIKVCDRWRISYENFYNDVGPKPSPKHNLDRIDNNGNYEPSNVRWATIRENNNNRSVSLKHPGVRALKGRDDSIIGWNVQLRRAGVVLYNERFNDYEKAVEAKYIAEQKYL